MVRPKRSLSQNFLVDQNIRRKLVETLDARPGDTVLEVGPGHGELTELLVGRVRRLVVVEKDDRLAPELAARWGDRDDVEVIHGDALEVDLAAAATPAGRPAAASERSADAFLGGFRLVSNVPYAITSPLLFRFLEIDPPPDRILVLVQEEVARRIVAGPGGKEYGALSVGVQTSSRADLAFRVGRQAFRPVPKVDSAAVVLEPLPPEPEHDREAVRNLVRAAFSRRRKQLRTILRSAPEYALEAEEAEAILRELGVDPAARPETLAPGQFVRLAMLLESGRQGRL